MSFLQTAVLGAVAGVTIFLGLPVSRMRGLPKSVQGFLNAFATGILIFILWDILSHASGPVDTALVAVRTDAATARNFRPLWGLTGSSLGIELCTGLRCRMTAI